MPYLFNMLNCFKDYWRYTCINISYHILDFIQQIKTKFTMEQPYMLPIICSQCYACWCPGDFRSQGISRHGIDQISRNILSLASEELSTLLWVESYTKWGAAQLENDKDKLLREIVSITCIRSMSMNHKRCWNISIFSKMIKAGRSLQNS